MKKQEYARNIKQLATKLRKEKVKGSLAVLNDPMTALLRGVLTSYAGEQRAEAAQARLLAATVDLNELRVTPISEIVCMMGPDFPAARFAAEEISRALNAVFNRLHHLDLVWLKTASRKNAENFLNGLEGVGGHAKAIVELRCLGYRVIPVDQQMLYFLQRNDCVAPEATVEEAQKLLASCISDREAESFYLTLKRHAHAHAPRRPLVVRPVPMASPAPATETATAAGESPSKVSVKEKSEALAKAALEHKSKQSRQAAAAADEDAPANRKKSAKAKTGTTKSAAQPKARKPRK